MRAEALRCSAVGIQHFVVWLDLDKGVYNGWVLSDMNAEFFGSIF